MENLQHQLNRYFVDNGATEWWLTGLKTTLLVTVIALCIGVVLGLLIALIRSTHEQTGKLKLLNIVARVYLTIIRGTPSMIQILFFYSVIFATVNLNNIVIGGIAFGINSGAYVAEIFRSGIMSVDKGQTEAGRSLGLNSAQTMRLIIIPQAFKKCSSGADQRDDRAVERDRHHRLYWNHRYYKSSNPGTEPYVRCAGSASLRSDLLSDSCYDSDLFHGQTGKETA